MLKPAFRQQKKRRLNKKKEKTYQAQKRQGTKTNKGQKQYLLGTKKILKKVKKGSQKKICVILKIQKN